MVDLTGRPLDTHTITLLNKGLNYAIVPKKTVNYTQPLDTYIRKLRWKDHFSRHPSLNSTRHPYAQKSNRIPPKASPHYEAYFRKLRMSLSNMQPIHVKANLTKNEHTLLNKLKKDTSIVIRGADKGSCVVVENTPDYIKNGLEHLADTSTYEELPADYTPTLVTRINHMVNLSYHLDRITKRFLTLDPQKVRTQCMYFLKKIHKTPMSIRPIVSGCSGPTEKLSYFVDNTLKKTLSTIPSYIKDTKAFINIIENLRIPHNALLVTVDVVGLYLNIPQKEGIERVIKYHYDKFPDEVVPKNHLRAFMQTILKHNIFHFAGKMFKQIKGTAMGTKFAPSFANIFMASVEEDFLGNYPQTPQAWHRYIDDIFMIWTDGRDSLSAFLDALNNHTNLKYTYTISDTSVEFLDAIVFKGPRMDEGKLSIRPFFKPTNKFQYTHFNSCHPSHIFSGIVKGETIRILRLSSEEQTYHRVRKFLAKKFRNRGYPWKLVRMKMHEVPYTLRPKYLAHMQPKEKEDDLVPFISQFQPQFPPSTIKQNILDPHIQEKPIMAFRKAKTLANHLVRATLPDHTLPDQVRSLIPFPSLT